MKTALSQLFWRWLPKKKMSRLMGKFAKSPISRHFIPLYIKHFKIDLEPVKRPVHEFENLLEFFIRELHPEARPIAQQQDVVISPVDGTISQIGPIHQGTLIQAKGVTYSLKELLSSESHARQFDGGQFVTVYLSPKDYHRIHMPVDGNITELTYVPGELYPVNTMGVKNIPGLFARNERVITYIQSDFGEIALVKVGATNVGSIKVEFDDKVSTNPYPAKPIFHKVYEEFHPLKKGAELGRFEFGSTIILLFEPVKIEWISSLQPGTSVKMGQSLARVLRTKGE